MSKVEISKESMEITSSKTTGVKASEKGGSHRTVIRSGKEEGSQNKHQASRYLCPSDSFQRTVVAKLVPISKMRRYYS